MLTNNSFVRTCQFLEESKENAFVSIFELDNLSEFLSNGKENFIVLILNQSCK